MQSIYMYMCLEDFTLQKQKGKSGYDPLFKVRSLINYLTAVFS